MNVTLNEIYLKHSITLDHRRLIAECQDEADLLHALANDYPHQSERLHNAARDLMIKCRAYWMAEKDYQ